MRQSRLGRTRDIIAPLAFAPGVHTVGLCGENVTPAFSNNQTSVLFQHSKHFVRFIDHIAVMNQGFEFVPEFLYSGSMRRKCYAINNQTSVLFQHSTNHFVRFIESFCRYESRF